MQLPYVPYGRDLLLGASAAVAIATFCPAQPAALPYGEAVQQAVPRTILVSPSADSLSGGAVHFIDDPSTGLEWLFLRDAVHPAGPGRLVVEKGPYLGGAKKPVAPSTELRRLVLVIHSGEPVVIEEHTKTADGQLSATALGPASQGDRLRIRLAIGGKIVLALAVAPGRVLLLPRQEAW